MWLDGILYPHPPPPTPPRSTTYTSLEQRCVGRGVCADRAFSIKLAWGMVTVDSGVQQAKHTVSFAYSLSQGHSQQTQILTIHHGTRIIYYGTLFPLQDTHGVKEHELFENGRQSVNSQMRENREARWTMTVRAGYHKQTICTKKHVWSFPLAAFGHSWLLLAIITLSLLWLVCLFVFNIESNHHLFISPNELFVFHFLRPVSLTVKYLKNISA